MLEQLRNEEVTPYLQANHLELGMTLKGMTFQLKNDITKKRHAKNKAGMTY